VFQHVDADLEVHEQQPGLGPETPDHLPILAWAHRWQPWPCPHRRAEDCRGRILAAESTELAETLRGDALCLAFWNANLPRRDSP
jgi:hypothetical protein